LLFQLIGFVPKLRIRGTGTIFFGREYANYAITPNTGLFFPPFA
jgi:hypothetical protein